MYYTSKRRVRRANSGNGVNLRRTIFARRRDSQLDALGGSLVRFELGWLNVSISVDTFPIKSAKAPGEKKHTYHRYRGASKSVKRDRRKWAPERHAKEKKEEHEGGRKKMHTYTLSLCVYVQLLAYVYL